MHWRVTNPFIIYKQSQIETASRLELTFGKERKCPPRCQEPDWSRDTRPDNFKQYIGLGALSHF